jgi:hypothetical protein
MWKSARPHGNLYELVVAIDAAEMLDPYPRLAQVMQRIAIQQAAMRNPVAIAHARPNLVSAERPAALRP